MRAEGITNIPALPEKHWLIRTSSNASRREKRARELQAWLHTLFQKATFTKSFAGETILDHSPALRDFLDLARGVQTAKEAAQLARQHDDQRRQRAEEQKQAQATLGEAASSLPAATSTSNSAE